MKLRYLLIAACGVATLTANAQQSIGSQVDLNHYRHIVKTISADDFQGRAPLSAGEKKTLSFIVNQFKKIGLEPGYKGSYLQPVPLAKITPNSDMALKVGDMSFKSGKDFTARTEQIRQHISLKNSDLVFVGYGIKAPEYQWDDFKGVDVKGKTLLMLVNDPGYATQDPHLFKGNAMTYYGRWTYKYEEAARLGAKAVFIIHQTKPAGYGWGVIQNSNTNSKFTLVDNHKNRSKIGVMGWIQEYAAKQILAKQGLDLAKLQAAAARRDFHPITLKAKVNLTIDNQIERAVSHNVVAKITGAKRPNEQVVLNAHWDHLGIAMENGKPEVMNGAVDNASGVAGVIELARIMHERAKTHPYARTLMFMDTTAEETGLLGAEQFAKHPPTSTKDIVAYLNIDGMNVNQAVDYILQYGKNINQLENYMAEGAAEQGRHVKMDPRPQNGLLYRSDHFALFQQGVPGLLFMSLGDTDPDYIKNKYHRSTDDYDPHWKLQGVVQDIDLIGRIMGRLANNDDWPKWIEASSFKKRRAKDGH